MVFRANTKVIWAKKNMEPLAKRVEFWENTMVFEEKNAVVFRADTALFGGTYSIVFLRQIQW